MAALVLGLCLTGVTATAPPTQAAVIDSFDKVFSTQTNGSITVTGNALMTCSATGAINGATCSDSLAGTGPGSSGNNNLFMVPLDADSDASTSSSSRAGLSLPPGATVLFAGLYWSAATTAGAGGGQPAAASRNLRLRVPGSATYQTVTPQTLNTSPQAGADFQAYRDVTALVRAAGGGNYWGADISAATGRDRYAGWSLVVAIADPNAPLRDLSVFNGYAVVSGTEVVDATISGFLTPPTGVVNAKIGTVTFEGDQQLTGDYFTLNGQRLADAGSPQDNFFRSRITTDGVNVADRSPASVNNLGMDAKVVDAAGAIPNGATSATLRFATNGDTYYPTVLTTQVDLYAPTIVGTKTVLDLAGNDPAQVGDTLEYTLTFSNVGDDVATNAFISDVLPANVTYVPGSLRITGGANQGTKTDAAGDDQGEYLAGSRTVRVRAGPDANATQGGTLAKLATQAVRFRVTVDLSAAGTTVVNRATLDYRAATLGRDYIYTTADVLTPVAPLADVSITKTAAPEPVAAGDSLTYTLTVDNAGPNPAVGSTVRDSLPDDTTYVSATATRGACGAPAAGVLTCALGTLPVGSTTTITVVVRVSAAFDGTGLANVASVSADTSDPDATNNSASATSTVVRSADLRMVKTASPAAPAPGTDVTYTLSVTNAGPSDATEVVVDDVLPAAYLSATATSSAGSCSVSGRAVRCTTSRLAAGATLSVSVSARLDPAWTGGPIDNTGTVSARTPDPVTSNNNATVTTTPGPARADVLIRKETLTSPVLPGQPVRYRITVSNDGPSDAQDVTLADTPPPALTGVTASPSQGACTAAIACDLGTVPAGATATVIVQATLDGGAAGTLTNTATVASPSDTSSGNNSSTTTDPVATRADLSIVKTAAPEPVVGGTDVTYTLTVDNDGPSTAENVRIRDEVPAPLVVVSAAPAGTCTVTGNTVVCGLGDLASGATATVTIVVSTPPAGGANGVQNTASVDSDTVDPDPSDNQAGYTLSTASQANVAIDKTVSPASVSPGDTITWTLTASNLGPSDATGVVVRDTVPSTVVITSVTPAATCTTTGQQVACTAGGLPAGQLYLVTIEGVLQAGADPGPLDNTGTVESATPPDPTTSDNSSTATTQVTTSADLSLTKTAPATAVAGGVPVSYTLRVDNAGPSDGRDVVVTDRLPAGTSFVSSPDCTLQAGSDLVVDCALGTVVAGGSRTVTVVVQVLGSVPDGTILVNAATVSSSTPDPDPTDNDDSATTTVATRADLSVAKSASPAPLVAGAEAVYTLVVDNSGPSDAQSVSVTDDLPAQVSLVSAVPSAGSCSGTTSVTCTRPLLAAGARWTITIRVFVGPSTTADQTNTARVSSATIDPDPSDDSTSIATPVDAAGDLAVVKTAAPEPLVPGQQVAYTLTVVNFGPATMTAAQLVDDLPAGLGEATATSAQGTCSVVGRQVTCALGPVAPGAPAVVTVTALLDPALSDTTLSNAATVSSPTRDTDPTNDTDDVVSQVVPSADLRIVKRSDVTPVAPGQAWDYFLAVTNDGPSVARDVVVTDTVVPALTVVAADVSGAPCAVAGQVVTCSLGSLAAGPVQVRIRVRLAPGYAGADVANTATVDTSTTDSDPSGNTATVTVPVLPQADLSVTKTRTAPAPPAPVAPGRPVTWLLVVANGGPSVARDVLLADDVDPALTGVTATTSVGTCAVSATNAVSCSLGELAPGDSVTVSVTAAVPASYLGSLTNTGVVESPTVDLDATNNTSTTTDPVSPDADLAIVKTRTSGPIVPGGAVGWRIEVTNAGPSVARDVVVVDDLADALVGVTATGPDGVTCTVASGNLIRCPLADLAPGAPTVVITLTAQVPPGLTGRLDNTAAVSSSTPDGNPANDSATSTGVAEPSADVAITKQRTSAPPVPGGTVTWTLLVTNAGPSTAAGTRVTDDVDDSLRAVAASGSGGTSCAVGVGNVVECLLGQIAPGDTVRVAVTATLPDGFRGALANAAEVASTTTDPDRGNNSAVVSDDVAAVDQPAAADLQLSKSVDDRSAQPGDRLTYRIRVVNLGPGVARDVIVDDDMPAGLVLESAGADQGDCRVTTRVRCRVGSLEAGRSVIITVRARVADDTAGSVRNVAAASASTSDPVADNNNDEATVAVTEVGPTDQPTTPTATLPDTGLGSWVLPLGLLGLLCMAVGTLLIVGNVRRKTGPDR